jgi:predicted RNA-binding Zn ribbon-like protein
MRWSLAVQTVTGQGGDVAFELLTDRPVLDFVATVSERGTTDLERLRTGDDLAAWVTRSRIVGDGLVVTSSQLEDAKALREALFALLAAGIDRTGPPPQDVGLVNAAARRRRPVLSLSTDGRVQRSGDLDAVLAELATDGLDLLDGPDRAALHWCAGPRCTRLFIDRSRGQRRRWCDMKGCGERAKAAAYRRRHHVSPAGS